ncbi:class I SAM-dependent methyltransferase [Aureibaculum marinum]|uniref:Class I SAM-dependent methyltransferase n=2 Tax=Pseudomonadati TaxID=3379134 RepID=A0A3N4N9G9_9FLAO|nr:class I SAM-dependent methyltransferase [Aureibaculum marinum]RPD91708.1 class I SAM-dependent methyltransferase [Aureibaculum marinum]
MLFQIASYFKFLVKSTNQHGVHSPFVYNLITKCFYDKKQKKWYSKLINYRQLLLQSDKIIEVTDFGAGSKTLKSQQRKVATIAKNAGISIKRAKLLGRMVSYLHADTILEIGTSLGISSAAMSFGNPKSKIATLEGCPKTADIAKTSFKHFNLSTIEVIIGNFTNTLPATLKQLSDNTTDSKDSLDLVYFDGNHQKEATLDYFEQCLPFIHNDSVFIFDDIYWSKGMQEAWTHIKKHPKVTVSIDTFYWGIVFFRKEQEKEDFVIRL